MDLIVILERTMVSPLSLRYLIRAEVPLARRPYFADPNKGSAYREADADTLAALRAGAYVEAVRDAIFGGMTVAAIKATMIEAQQAFQAKVTSDAGWNPYKFYGTRWDGTAWTTGGVN